MKPVKGTSSLRAKREGRRKKLITFNELDETKLGETWFEYSTNAYLNRKIKREIKQERHNKLIEELRHELSLVQDEMEKYSLGLTSDVHSTIDADLKSMEEKYQYVKDGTIDHADMKSSLNKICAEATDLSSQRKVATEKLYEMLIHTEEKRSKRIAAILDKFQKLFAENDYLDQSEIKVFFGCELMNVNDGMLKNVSYYRELRQRYNDSTNKCLDSLKSLCEQRIAAWDESLISDLQSKLKMASKFNLIEKTLDSKQFTHLQLSFDSELKNFTEKWNPLELIMKNQNTFEPWFETLENTLETVDYIARDLLQENEAFLSKRYADCESDVNNVQECCSSGTAELFQPLLKILKDQTETTAYDLKVEWGAFIFNILEEIDGIKEIFKAAEDFKRKYNESLVNLQSTTYNHILFEKENSTSMGEKEKDIEEIENRVKVALNADTANNLTAEVNDIYEEKKMRLQDFYDKAIKILDSFLETFKNELNFMRAEIETSVSFYGDKSKHLVDISNSQNGKPAFLLSIQNQFKSVQESQSRVLSFLVSEFPTILEDDCAERAKVWILSKRQTIRTNFEEEMSSLSSSWDYFLNAVYAPRLQVIREHADYFKKCKQTLKDSFPEIEVETIKTMSKLKEVNEKFNTWIESTQKRIYAAYRSSDLQSILSKVFERGDEFKSSMRNLTNKYIEIMSTKEETVINDNFDLVQNLLSLAEQNVYTNEEITVFCDEFFKLEKAIISKRQNLKEDVLKRNCFLTDESQQHLSLLIESLHQHEADLSFTETVVQFVRKSRTELKELAFSMKRSGKLLSRQIAELTQVVTSDTIWPDNAETVILERWKLLLESLKNRSDLLFKISEENASNNELNKDNVNNHVNISITNNSFLDKVYDILRKCTKQIEEVAKNYYMGNQSRKTKAEQVHATYDDLMNEIMQKCNKYAQQCHLAWFKEMCDFVNIVGLFKEGINSYIVRFVSNLHETSVKIINMHDRVATRNLKMFHDNGSQWIREISTNLRPAHGLPKNEPLLNNLKVLFDNCCSTYELMSEENVKKYTLNGEEILENASNDLRFKLRVIRSVLLNIVDGNVLRNIIFGLKEEFERMLGQRSSSGREGHVTLNELCPDGDHIDLVIKSVPVPSSTEIDKLRSESARLKLMALAEEEVSSRTIFDKIEEGSISQFVQNLREMHARTSTGLTKMDSAFKSSIKEARFEWDINEHSIKSIFTLPTN